MSSKRKRSDMYSDCSECNIKDSCGIRDRITSLEIRANIKLLVRCPEFKRVNKIIELVELNYCPRTKHSRDMPLKKATRVCVFRHEGRCSYHPSLITYCKINKIEVDLSTRFACVLGK